MSEKIQALTAFSPHVVFDKVTSPVILARDGAEAPTVAFPRSRDGERPAVGRRFARGWVTYSPFCFRAALIVVPTPLLSSLFLHESEPIPRLLLAVGSILAALAAAWVWQHGLIVGHRRNLTAAILMVSGLVIASSILWNESYLKFSRTVRAKEVFRTHLRRSATPAYGLPHWSPFHRDWPAILVGMCAVFAVSRVRLDTPMTRKRLAAVVSFQIAGIYTLALSEGHSRPAGQSFQFVPFKFDAAQFSGVFDLLNRYVHEMPSLSWFGCHYPPGSALLLLAQRLVGEPFPLAMLVIFLTTAASTIPVYLAAAELLPRRYRVHQLATFAYAATTGPLIFASISTTPLVLLPASLGLWSFLRATRTGGIWPAIVVGLCMPVFAMISLSVAFFSVVLALCAIAYIIFKLRPQRYVIRTIAVSLGSAIGVVFAMRMATGFDLIACAREGLLLHHAQAGTNGFDTAGSHFMRSSGNLLAFVLMNLPLIGIAITGLLLWRRSDWRLPQRILLPATMLAMLFAAASGAFFLETERIWMFFVPPLALAAAVELGRYPDERGQWESRLAIVMMIAFALTQELGFKHYIQ